MAASALGVAASVYLWRSGRLTLGEIGVGPDVAWHATALFSAPSQHRREICDVFRTSRGSSLLESFVPNGLEVRIRESDLEKFLRTRQVVMPRRSATDG